MTRDDDADARMRRIEQELLPDTFLHVLVARDAAFATGRLHGQVGRIDQALTLDPEHGDTYRRGLSLGRAGNIDAQLTDLYGDVDDLAIRARFDPDRIARWTLTEYGESGAWLGEISGWLGIEHDDVAGACRAAAGERALWWEPAWIGVAHCRVEVTTDTGIRNVTCAQRQLIRPVEPGFDPEWAVELIYGEHEHPARPASHTP